MPGTDIGATPVTSVAGRYDARGPARRETARSRRRHDAPVQPPLVRRALGRGHRLDPRRGVETGGAVPPRRDLGELLVRDAVGDVADEEAADALRHVGAVLEAGPDLRRGERRAVGRRAARVSLSDGAGAQAAGDGEPEDHRHRHDQSRVDGARRHPLQPLAHIRLSGGPKAARALPRGAVARAAGVRRRARRASGGWRGRSRSAGPRGGLGAGSTISSTWLA